MSDGGIRHLCTFYRRPTLQSSSVLGRDSADGGDNFLPAEHLSPKRMGSGRTGTLAVARVCPLRVTKKQTK